MLVAQQPLTHQLGSFSCSCLLPVVLCCRPKPPGALPRLCTIRSRCPTRSTPPAAVLIRFSKRCCWSCLIPSTCVSQVMAADDGGELQTVILDCLCLMFTCLFVCSPPCNCACLSWLVGRSGLKRWQLHHKKLNKTKSTNQHNVSRFGARRSHRSRSTVPSPEFSQSFLLRPDRDPVTHAVGRITRSVGKTLHYAAAWSKMGTGVPGSATAV